MDQKNNLNDLIVQLLAEIRELKRQLLLIENPISKDWVPRDQVMNYLGYGDTQMAYLAKKFGFKVSKVGKRRFYRREAILQMLDSGASE